MSISHWEMADGLVFRGRCSDHIVHHAIVQFGLAIQREIERTRATFGTDDSSWPFKLLESVRVEIHEEGYKYIPYRFELDDERIYELLMGGALYPNPLMAVRELIQNAVDACALRDSLSQLAEPFVSLKATGRIVVRYEEPTDALASPVLTVSDTGSGMDQYILENYFLKVGQSYYRSPAFNRDRVELRRKGLDFAPVSEFGIGFLSCFLLADRVEVTTALWEPYRGDNRKRLLVIDGPTRLIRLDEEPNDGPSRFKGTSVRMELVRGLRAHGQNAPPTWDDIKSFLNHICQDLPYRIHLEYSNNGETTTENIDPKPLQVWLPHYLEPVATRIPVADKELEGEITILNPYKTEEIEQAYSASVVVRDESRSTWAGSRESFAEDDGRNSSLLRGGFLIGGVPGLPDSFVSRYAAGARLRLLWKDRHERRYLGCNLSRTEISDQSFVAERVTRVWLSYFLDHLNELPDGQLLYLGVHTDFLKAEWLQKYSAFDLYSLARTGWHARKRLASENKVDPVKEWEDGARARLNMTGFRTDLHWRLLDLVLPRVAKLQMGREGAFYVARPTPQWKNVLLESHDFISAPITWGSFVEYTDGIEELLIYEYPGAIQFNVRYQDKLTSFTEGELGDLLRALHRLADARGHAKQPVLTNTQRNLVMRAKEVCGDLYIGELSGQWKLSTFVI